MRAVIVFAVTALALSACSKSPKTIAENSCPLIAVTPDGNKMARLKILIDEGVAPSKAADLLYPYESVISSNQTLPATFDKRELCTASVSEDKASLKAILEPIAAQQVDQVFRRRAQAGQ